MDLYDEISSSSRHQKGPEEAFLKKPLQLEKKNVAVFQSIIQENKRQLIILNQNLLVCVGVNYIQYYLLSHTKLSLDDCISCQQPCTIKERFRWTFT